MDNEQRRRLDSEQQARLRGMRSAPAKPKLAPPVPVGQLPHQVVRPTAQHLATAPTASRTPARQPMQAQRQHPLPQMPATTTPPPEPSLEQTIQLDLPESVKKKRPLKKMVGVLVIIALLGAGGFFGYTKFMKNSAAHAPATLGESTAQSEQNSSGDVSLDPVKAVNQAENQTTTSTKEKIRLIATGDMLPHDAINARAKKDSGYDYLQFMMGMKPFFEKADLRFCNQAVLGAGESFGITGYPVFNSPTQVQKDMAALGCDIINTGTNHTNDKGQDAINASVAAWDGITSVKAIAGAGRSQEEQAKIHYFEQDGVKFAFLSYATYTNKPNPTPYSLKMYDKASAEVEVAEAKKNSDIVIVSMRWGTEYSPTVNAEQDRIAQELADMGAGIVLGHGPHVLEPVKRLTGSSGNETVVWFSLGNFLNAQLDVEDLVNCVAVLDIDTASKKVTAMSCLPIYSSYEWSAAEKASSSLLARKNFQLMPLENAGDFFAKAQLSTTVDAQKARIQSTLNTYTPVTMITSSEY